MAGTGAQRAMGCAAIGPLRHIPRHECADSRMHGRSVHRMFGHGVDEKARSRPLSFVCCSIFAPIAQHHDGPTIAPF
mgnify:CR=1 FL=1